MMCTKMEPCWAGATAGRWAHLAKDASVFIPPVEPLQSATELRKIEGAAKLMFEGLLNFLLRENICAVHNHALDDGISSCLQDHPSVCLLHVICSHLYGTGLHTGHSDVSELCVWSVVCCS